MSTDSRKNVVEGMADMPLDTDPAAAAVAGKAPRRAGNPAAAGGPVVKRQDFLARIAARLGTDPGPQLQRTVEAVLEEMASAMEAGTALHLGPLGRLSSVQRGKKDDAKPGEKRSTLWRFVRPKPGTGDDGAADTPAAAKGGAARAKGAAARTAAKPGAKG